MSQQINLLLPELRPRFDWLALPVVAGAALVALLGVAVAGELASLRSVRLGEQEARLHGQLLALQDQVQQLGKALGGRRANPALGRQIADAKIENGERREVLDFVGAGKMGETSGFSGTLNGFSRQATEGVWLVGFTLAGKDVGISGRLADPALLPVYINHLNSDPAFVGRHFAALDMKGVDPAPAAEQGGAPAALPPYTEFTLRTNADKPMEKTP